MLSGGTCARPGSQSCGAGTSDTPDTPYCCLEQTADCGQPASFTTGAGCDGGSQGACEGTPQVESYAGRSVSGTFADGCSVDLPICTNEHPYQCTCRAGVWSCENDSINYQ